MNNAQYLTLLIVFICVGCRQDIKVKEGHSMSQKIDIAAYIWPSCQDEPRSREKLWSEGIGEWEIIKKGTPRFEGHYQPRQPLWGYLMDDDPFAMEMKIDAATSHGVNVFIFDWYWYDGAPFLEGALNNGFLKAKNKNKMQFYLMWANHDVPGNMWNPYRYKNDSLLWEGNVSKADFDKIVQRVITNYFSQTNYFKIDNKPVFSLYNLDELVQSFGSLEGARDALAYLRKETIKAGFAGLHLQMVGKYAHEEPNYGTGYLDVNEIASMVGANSTTMYNMAGENFRKEDYISYLANGIELRDAWDTAVTIPVIPCVSVGWDTTPRYPVMDKEKVIHLNNTPDSFGAGLLKAKQFVEDRPEQVQLIIVNAWNEWVEGSYLEPDLKWGYGYLNKVKEVMSEK